MEGYLDQPKTAENRNTGDFPKSKDDYWKEKL